MNIIDVANPVIKSAPNQPLWDPDVIRGKLTQQHSNLLYGTETFQTLALTARPIPAHSAAPGCKSSHPASENLNWDQKPEMAPMQVQQVMPSRPCQVTNVTNITHRSKAAGCQTMNKWMSQTKSSWLRSVAAVTGKALPALNTGRRLLSLVVGPKKQVRFTAKKAWEGVPHSFGYVPYKQLCPI